MFDEGGAGFSDDMIIVRDDDGVAYAVPRTEMERFRMTPERRSSVLAELLAEADASGSALLTRDSAPVYEVDTAALAPYRLSKEEWTRLEAVLHAGSSDVRGFGSGTLRPSWVAVAPPLHGTPQSRVHTYPSWYWFSSGRAAPSDCQPGAGSPRASAPFSLPS